MLVGPKKLERRLKKKKKKRTQNKVFDCCLEIKQGAAVDDEKIDTWKPKKVRKTQFAVAKHARGPNFTLKGSPGGIRGRL